MSFASVATLLHDPNRQDRPLHLVCQAAEQWHAHAQVICAGIDSADPAFYYTGAQAIAVQQNLEVAREVSETLAACAHAQLKAAPFSWDVDVVSMMAGGLTPYLADHMRFADLAVLPLPYGAGRSQIDVTGFEACLFGADIPVMVVPDAADWPADPARIMVAWDNGAEAMAAVRAALPLIKRATKTEICIIDPPAYGIDRSDPGGRLAEMLTRLGARVEITVAGRQDSDIATQLRNRARDIGADIIVMGAYGHSRLREAVIGGVTRSMMRETELPVLLAR